MFNPFSLDMTKMKTMTDSLKAELDKTVIEGESGAGMVRAKVTGLGRLISIEVTDEVYAMGDKNDMCVLIVSAVNAALEKASRHMGDAGMSALSNMGINL